MTKAFCILFAVFIGHVVCQYSSNGGGYAGNGGTGPQSRGAYSGILTGSGLGRQGAYGSAQSRGGQQGAYGRQAGGPQSYNGGQGSYGGQRGGYGAGSRAGYGSGADDATFEPANYEFSYEVSAPEYGVEFGHEEQRQGEEATGNFRVLLPDGRRQIVEYTANQDGYKPTISYEETGAGNGGYGRSGNGYGNNGYGASGRSQGNGYGASGRSQGNGYARGGNGHQANGHAGNGLGRSGHGAYSNGIGLSRSGSGSYGSGNGFGRSSNGAYGGRSDAIAVNAASQFSTGIGAGAY